MAKGWMLGFLALLAMGCGEAHLQRPDGPAQITGLSEDGCPTIRTEVPPEACAHLPAEYGLTKELPVEWGIGGGTPLYGGRLLCSDGSRPAQLGRGSIGPAPVPSQSPPGGFPIRTKDGKPLDIVDAWSLQCGEEKITLYSNPYRCGSPCVPAPFRLLSPTAHRASQLAARLSKEGNDEEALAYAKEAVDADSQALHLHVRLAYAWLAIERPQEGVDAADSGLERFPGSRDLQIVRSFAQEKAERLDEAYEGFDGLLTDNQFSSKLRPMILCRKAAVSRKLGKMEEFHVLRVASCEAGFEPCCQEPPPPAE